MSRAAILLCAIALGCNPPPPSCSSVGTCTTDARAGQLARVCTDAKLNTWFNVGGSIYPCDADSCDAASASVNEYCAPVDGSPDPTDTTPVDTGGHSRPDGGGCTDDNCDVSPCVLVHQSDGSTYWRSCTNRDCPCANN